MVVTNFIKAFTIQVDYPETFYYFSTESIIHQKKHFRGKLDKFQLTLKKHQHNICTAKLISNVTITGFMHIQTWSRKSHIILVQKFAFTDKKYIVVLIQLVTCCWLQEKGVDSIYLMGVTFKIKRKKAALHKSRTFCGWFGERSFKDLVLKIGIDVQQCIGGNDSWWGIFEWNRLLVIYKNRQINLRLLQKVGYGSVIVFWRNENWLMNANLNSFSQI